MSARQLFSEIHIVVSEVSFGVPFYKGLKWMNPRLRLFVQVTQLGDSSLGDQGQGA